MSRPMNKEEFDSIFREKISLFTLMFRNPKTEDKYNSSLYHEKSYPWWYRLMMLVLIILIILKRMETFTFAHLNTGLYAESFVVEATCLTVLFIIILLEIIMHFCKPLTKLRGLALLIGSYFTIDYNSINAFPTKPGIVPAGLTLYLICILASQMYLKTWLVAGASGILGIVALSVTSIQSDTSIFYRIPNIVMMICAYIVFSMAAYVSEYNKRFLFYKSLKESNEKEQWKNLLDQLPLGVVIYNDKNITYFNDECLRMFEETSNLTVDHFAVLKENSGKLTVKDIISGTSTLSRVQNMEFTLKREGKPNRYYCVRITSITFRGKKSTALLLQDQTSFEELKRLDERYQRLYMSSIVHDIRTPLNGILGMLEAIEQTESREEAKSFIAVARNSGKLLLYLTYDITDFSQIEAGVISIAKEVFSPAELVNECIKLLEFNFKRKGISLSYSADMNVPIKVWSDKNRYTQVLLNLLGNALKFTFTGSVTIDLYYSKPDDLLITTVADTGIGIKQQDIPKLFKLFGKIKESTEHNPTGVGLGLAICKRLVERLGGHVTAESEFGKGSKFTYSITCNLDQAETRVPVNEFENNTNEHTRQIFVESPMSADRDMLSSTRPMLKSCVSLPKKDCHCTKLLVVDDNDYNLLVLQSFSSILKIPCDIARNGSEAVEKVKDKYNDACCKSYGIILMDINMPVMDGIEATARIRMWEDNNAIPRAAIIALTAADTESQEQKEKLTGLGFNSLIGKPISKNSFCDLLAEYAVTN